MGNKTENATVKTAAFITNEHRNNKNIFVIKSWKKGLNLAIKGFKMDLFFFDSST